MTDFKTNPRGLDIDQVCARLGGKTPLDKSTVWRWSKKDPEFPRPYYLWGARPRWVEEEIDGYISKKIAERDDPVHIAAQRERVDRREQTVSEARARAREAKTKPRLKRGRSKGSR
jgi:predicted DNA-binding transcriptional regulator AlpA